MAHEQRFRDRLQQQLQQAGARILHLEALHAQKDDQLANASAQIQRLQAKPASSSGSQAVTAAVQSQINQATTRAMSAENHLRESVTRFNRVHASLQQQISRLKKENEALTGSNGGTEWASLKTEMGRIRKAYAMLEKQFEAEKRKNAKGASFSATAKGKGKAAAAYEADEDEDDEEPR